jgi:hypothetical protein
MARSLLVFIGGAGVGFLYACLLHSALSAVFPLFSNLLSYSFNGAIVGALCGSTLGIAARKTPLPLLRRTLTRAFALILLTTLVWMGLGYINGRQVAIEPVTYQIREIRRGIAGKTISREEGEAAIAAQMQKMESLTDTRPLTYTVWRWTTRATLIATIAITIIATLVLWKGAKA